MTDRTFTLTHLALLVVMGFLLLGAPANGLALATVVGVVGLMTLGLIENSPKGH